MPHSPQAVANEFLDRARREGRTLTPMHLQKLVYIAHGWMLAITHRPLVSESVEAWQFGPVYPSLYDSLKRYGPSGVTEPIRENNWSNTPAYRGEVVSEQFDADERAVIERVYQNYADLEAFQLSALTHAEGTPWTATYEQGQNRSIPNDRIRDHFISIAQRRAA